MKKLVIVPVLAWSILTICDYPLLRMTKNEKVNLECLVGEPLRKIELKIDGINQAANQIQNYIIDNYNQPNNEIKEQYHHILNKLSHLGLLLEALAYVVQAQGQATQDLANQINDLEAAIAELAMQIANLQVVVGSLDDVSVGEQEFNSVEDIDNAQLSIISWLKSIYREQLYNKFVS